MEADSTRPVVSVLMAVRNGEGYLADALRSIIGQTFQDFECIVVDDGSEDRTSQLVKEIGDKRFRLVENKQSLGLSASLNHGLKFCRGLYVIRMDHDDLCLLNRFERQVAFMESNPLIAAAGCWLQTFGFRNEIWRYPVDHEEIRCHLLFGPPLQHPAMILRTDAFRTHELRYDESFAYAQDYDLWERAASRLQLANIPEVLLKYRIYSEQERPGQVDRQRSYADLVRRRQLVALGFQPTEQELLLHSQVSCLQVPGTPKDLAAAGQWLLDLRSANDTIGFFPRDVFERVLARRWATLCLKSSNLGLISWRTFSRYVPGTRDGMTWRERLLFRIKCRGEM